MKIRNRILLLASLLLLVSVGGIGNLMWQMPLVDQAHNLKAVLQGLILLGLFGVGLIFSVLELVRYQFVEPIFRLEKEVALISQLQDIVNRSGCLVFVWRILPGKWPVEFVSDNVADILGYSADDFVSGRVSWPGITHPDDIPLLEREVAGYLESGTEKWSQEYRLITNSGEIKWFCDESLVVPDSDGKPEKIQAIIRDITKRKEAEEKVTMLSDAIETAHHGCLIIAEDYKVIFGNDYAISKLDFDFDELKNIDLFSICADREQVKNIIETMKVTKRWMGEIVVTKKDGKQFPALVSVTALDADNDPSGKRGNIILFQDMTVQKEMREKLMASERLAVMGRLVADVAHELNNPLAIIIGGTQLILKQLDEKKPELQNQLERILRNGKRCKTILTNLLGYGQTVAKKSELVNIQELVHEAIDGVSFQYDMSGIETALNCDKLCNVNVAGNRAALLSVFINLARNARQAMGSKGKLLINLGKQDDDSIRVEIGDTGIGLSEEQKDNLFKPFVSGWMEGEGSGLGLATSLGIVETHGGKMTAFSNGVGQGTTFVVTLPYSAKEDEPSQ